MENIQMGNTLIMMLIKPNRVRVRNYEAKACFTNSIEKLMSINNGNRNCLFVTNIIK